MADDDDDTDELYDEVVEACERQQRLLRRWLRVGGEIRRSTDLPGVLAIDIEELLSETEPLTGRR
jgi:hypothetical protein